MSFNFNRAASVHPDNVLIGHWIDEAIQLYGVPIIYYPIYKYDGDGILGEDDLPRYAEGMMLTAYYKEAEAMNKFSKFGFYEMLQAGMPIFVSKREFTTKLPTQIRQSSAYIAPVEGDWFKTLKGDERYYTVTNVVEAEQLLGEFHSYKIDAEPRVESYEDAGTDYGHFSVDSIITSSSIVTGALGLPDERIQNDDVIDEGSDVTEKQDSDNYWGNW